jgi:carotenoid 1,2-hydratase
VIAFVGSVFSPYYHWSGRGSPENHVAVNVALYGPDGNSWAMTERGRYSLSRAPDCLSIGNSRLVYDGGGLDIRFDETALPWPGQRLLPKRMRGHIRIVPEARCSTFYDLDPDGRHLWWPVFPRARIRVVSDHLPGGGWQGEAYHDFNAGIRPLEADFAGWDWARGRTGADSATILYDAVLKDGTRQTLGLAFPGDGPAVGFSPPPRRLLPRGFWGVRGGICCDEDATPRQLRRLEDSPFYSRALIETRLEGNSVTMVQETLNCQRLANPLVRLMLPFRMPRRAI